MSLWLTILVEFWDLAFHDFHASRIQLQTVSCYTRIVLTPIQTLRPTATPFVSTLGAQGDLSYPLFGLSLTQNTTGSLAIGAIDSSVVKNVSKIVWNEVMPFAPLDSTNNVSSYLQWAIRLMSFAVRGILLNRNPNSQYLNRSMAQWSHLSLHIQMLPTTHH
jgi:hypothetical protein